MFVLNQTNMQPQRRTSMSPLDAMAMQNGAGDVDGAVREPYVEGNLKLLQVLDCPKEVMVVRFSHDGSLLAVGLLDGTIKIYNPDTGQCIYSLSDDDTHHSRLPVTSIHFRTANTGDSIEHTNMLNATYASGMIKFWHYTSNSCLHTINEVRQTLTSAFNPQGTKFLTAGADPAIYLYDEVTKRKIGTLEPSDSRDVMNGHRMRVFAVQYHPFENHMFISGGWDDTVQFWDERQKHAIKKIYGPHICGDALDIDPIHNHILTGSWRKHNTLQIWDYRNTEKIKDVPQDNLHGSLLYCAQWLGKESIICGGCEQNMARVIDRGTLNTTGQLVDLPQGVYSIDNDRHSSKPRIAIAAEAQVYLLKMEKKT